MYALFWSARRGGGVIGGGARWGGGRGPVYFSGGGAGQGKGSRGRGFEESRPAAACSGTSMARLEKIRGRPRAMIGGWSPRRFPGGRDGRCSARPAAIDRADPAQACQRRVVSQWRYALAELSKLDVNGPTRCGTSLRGAHRDLARPAECQPGSDVIREPNFGLVEIDWQGAQTTGVGSPRNSARPAGAALDDVEIEMIAHVFVRGVAPRRELPRRVNA